MTGYKLAPPFIGEVPSITGIKVRVGEDAKRSVIFFGVEEDTAIKYGGTGFLLADTEKGVPVPFLVTCRHVAKLLEKFDEFYIRINARDGDAATVPSRLIEWTYPDDKTVDLAVASVGINEDLYNVNYYPLHAIGFSSWKDRKAVAAGDPVSLVGLFRLHAGTQKNVPFVHTGNVAVLPDPTEHIPVRDRISGEIVRAEVYLIEAQTLDGLSGSPVFVHETVGLEDFKLKSGSLPKAYGDLRLLGLYSGSWDAEPGIILAADRNLKGGHRVPVGVGLVVPADKIVELIREHPDMKEVRAARAKRHLENYAPSQYAALDLPPTSDVNPTHREDFNRLSSAAARKPPQED
jgi:hypothetical protein